MVHSPDRFSSRPFLTGEFPLDRPVSPPWLTVPASHVYARLVRFVLDRYSGERVRHAGVPVISVGNLMAGGTGKTPLVIALVRLLAKRFPALAVQNRIAVLSRGYGRKSHALTVVEKDTSWENAGDEPIVIKRAVPHAAVLVHPKRVESAEWAVKRLDARVLILDDGFQHRQLARDVDIVVLDGQHPLGNGWTLPAGPLREFPDSLSRATLVVGIGDQTTKARELSEKFMKPFVSAVSLVKWPEELEKTPASRVYLLTSIARPSRFVQHVREKGLNIVGHRVFRDHHRFHTRELLEVVRSAESAGADLILTTEKDCARLGIWRYRVPLIHASLELEFNSVNEIGLTLERAGLSSVS